MTDIVIEQFQHVLGEVRVSLQFREAFGVIGLQLLVRLLVRGEIGHRIRQPALAMSVFEDVFNVFPEVIIPMLQDITEIGTVTLHQAKVLQFQSDQLVFRGRKPSRLDDIRVIFDMLLVALPDVDRESEVEPIFFAGEEVDVDARSPVRTTGRQFVHQLGRIAERREAGRNQVGFDDLEGTRGKLVGGAHRRPICPTPTFPQGADFRFLLSTYLQPGGSDEKGSKPPRHNLVSGEVRSTMSP